MLMYLYKIFILLPGHFHFFLHLFFTFMENLFKKHPIREFYMEARARRHPNDKETIKLRYDKYQYI